MLKSFVNKLNSLARDHLNVEKEKNHEFYMEIWKVIQMMTLTSKVRLLDRDSICLDAG